MATIECAEAQGSVTNYYSILGTEDNWDGPGISFPNGFYNASLLVDSESVLLGKTVNTMTVHLGAIDNNEPTNEYRIFIMQEDGTLGREILTETVSNIFLTSLEIGQPSTYHEKVLTFEEFTFSDGDRIVFEYLFQTPETNGINIRAVLEESSEKFQFWDNGEGQYVEPSGDLEGTIGFFMADNIDPGAVAWEQACQDFKTNTSVIPILFALIVVVLCLYVFRDIMF